MEGTSGVIALVLAETAAGGAAVMWLTGLWGKVKRGFFILTTSVVLGCALLATLAASSAHDPAAGGARPAVVLAAATSVLLGLSLSALILRLLPTGRLLGVAAIPVSAVMLVALASVAETSIVPAALQLIAGAVFMGAVLDGMLLGHWYLVDRGLARDHIQRLGILLLASVALEGAAVAVGAATGTIRPTEGFSPLLTVGGDAIWLTIVLGMVGLTALIGALIHASLRDRRPRAVQAATGFFYLAVITAFSAELAAKVRFLG